MVQLIEYITQILTILFVVISIIIGLLIITKYREKKRQEFLYFGLFWAGMTTPWWPQVAIFITYLFTGAIIEMDFWVILGVAFLPFTVIIGVMAYLIVLPINPDKRKIIKVITYTPNVIYEIFLILAVILGRITEWVADHNPMAEGGEFLIKWSLFSVPYFILSLIFFLIFGIWFSRLSMEAENPELKLRGKFLFIAFISFAVGTMIDFIIPNTTVYLIARLILLSSTIEFYFGLILPKMVSKIFLKEE